MPLQRHTLKPRDTLWISVEVIVAYSCDSPPEVKSSKIRGLRQFAFIVGHEYDVDVMVDEAKRVPCQQLDCDYAARHDYDIKIFVSDTIGLGLGIGNWGTGTAGWSFPATEETQTLETPCICCDDTLEGKRMYLESKDIQRRALDSVSLIIGFSALASAIALSVVYFDHPSSLGKIFLSGVSFVLFSSVLVALRRVLALVTRRKHERDAVKRAEPMA